MLKIIRFLTALCCYFSTSSVIGFCRQSLVIILVFMFLFNTQSVLHSKSSDICSVSDGMVSFTLIKCFQLSLLLFVL